MTTHFHTLAVAEVRRETPDAVSIAFDVPEDLRDDYAFTQGQYLTLKTEIGGEEVRRSYSICCGADDGELRVAIKKVEGGAFSTYANENLKPGDRVEVMTPEGRFFTALDPDQHKTYVAFAAGSGITPVMSIIRTTLAREPNSRFTLVYGNRSSKGIIFREALEDLKNLYPHRFTLIHILSREDQEVELLNGRIDRAKCADLFRSLIRVDQVDEFFVCGPGTMIEDVTQALRDQDVSKERIHFEIFATGQAPTALARKVPKHTGPAPDDAEITVVIDGRETSFHLTPGGQPILDAALAHGADVPFACKGGVCCTCRAKLVEGEVDMDVVYGLEDEEIAAGYVLTCQSHPRSKRVVVNYDR